MTHRSFINKILLAVFVSLVCASAPLADALAGNGGGKGQPGNGNGAEPEPLYRANEVEVVGEGLINGDPIDSTNLHLDKITFRPSAGFTVNLSGFPVEDPDSSGDCPGFGAETTGTMTLTTGDLGPPDAELRFGFQGQLSNDGDTVQYYLVMRGTMVGNWLPTTITELTFDSWEIFAENKKSQRSDCEGGDDFGESVMIDISPLP